MKLRFGLLVAAIAAGPFAAHAQGSVDRDLRFERTRSATATATVKKVDQKTRMVTVVGESGKPETFEASKEVKNLEQLKPGDVVTIDYYDSVVVSVSKPGKEEAPPSGASAAATRAKPGEKPGGVAGAEVTIVANVEAIAPDKSSVTLKTRDGETKTLPVKNPENLTGVKVGDQVTIEATRAVAVAVTPAKNAKPAKEAKGEKKPK